MEAKDVVYFNGKYKYLFEIPFRYGYVKMLDMAQYVIDYYFFNNISSFRVSILAGMQEKEYKCILRLHRNKLNKCKKIQEEHGVLYLRGESVLLDDEIEVVWFNQTNIIGVAGNSGDEYHRIRIERMLDGIINNCA